MRRGTTPTLKIKVNGISLSELKNIYITLKQYNKVLTKTNNDLQMDEDIISVLLSQEETLMFGSGQVSVQIRATTVTGLAVASNIQSAPMNDILQEGVIE